MRLNLDTSVLTSSDQNAHNNKADLLIFDIYQYPTGAKHKALYTQGCHESSLALIRKTRQPIGQQKILTNVFCSGKGQGIIKVIKIHPRGESLTKRTLVNTNIITKPITNLLNFAVSLVCSLYNYVNPMNTLFSSPFHQ